MKTKTPAATVPASPNHQDNEQRAEAIYAERMPAATKNGSAFRIRLHSMIQGRVNYLPFSFAFRSK
jgi:hypothetical protein